MFNYTNIMGKKYQMNNFISAFYDAVLLYAIALRETLDAGGDPRNGTEVTARMWNRTFEGERRRTRVCSGMYVVQVSLAMYRLTRTVIAIRTTLCSISTPRRMDLLRSPTIQARIKS
jgi:hypothetical protein